MGPFKRLKEGNDDDNKDCSFEKMLWKLRKIWNDWADLRNEGIEDKWKTVNETEVIGRGFWALLVIEKMKRSCKLLKPESARTAFLQKKWPKKSRNQEAFFRPHQNKATPKMAGSLLKNAKAQIGQKIGPEITMPGSAIFWETGKKRTTKHQSGRN